MVEYSLTELTLRLGALLLPPIPEGVIGVKPRGDTREKQRTIRFLFGVGLSYSNPTGRILQRTKILGFNIHEKPGLK